MQQELVQDLRQQQILLKEINSELKKKNTELESSKNNTRQTTQILKSQSKNKKTRNHLTLLSVAVITVIMFATMGIGTDLFEQEPVESSTLKSKYVIENLKGDTIDTWKSWNIVPGTTLTVNIVNSDLLDNEKIQIIKETITSSETLIIDDSLTHKGPKGTSSTYYLGWSGSLNDAAELYSTKYPIPNSFDIIESGRGEGDIIINLSNLKDGDGIAGYTKSIVDGNEILKSHITLFDVQNLSESQLSTIALHEMGHALGLGHSTAPEDLMYPVIETNFPYISECDVSAIVALYNGEIEGEVVCEK